MAIQSKQLTLKQFLRLPEEKPALEFTDGVVTQKVSPKARHSVLQYRLAERVNQFSEHRKLAFAFPELRATFAGASVVPDVSVFTWDRIARDEKGEPLDDVFAPPDIAFEIVSPGQRVALVSERCQWYVENGVRISAMTNPRDRSMTMFRQGASPIVLRGDDEIDLTDVLPGFSFTVADLFAALVLV